MWKGYTGLPTDQSYCNKTPVGQDGYENSNKLVDLSFYDYDGEDTNKNHSIFYFRTAYRNDPSLAIKGISAVEAPTAIANKNMMIENDQEVAKNYHRLISKTLECVYDTSYNEKSVATLRDELIGKIRESLTRLFGDLTLSGVGNPTENGDFLFDKGVSKNYSYKNLSGGEKAAFDLILDLVIKQKYYPDTIFCIDEPEAHMHTALQEKLLGELYTLIGANGQLWIATHSLGMLNKAKELEAECPGSVAFLNFDGFDFDDVVQIMPSPVSHNLWNRILSLTLENYSTLLAPETVVFCEGTTRGRKRKDFDAKCYANIFSTTHPSTVFYSLGGCNDIEEDKLKVIGLTQAIVPNTNVIRIIDRDDRSENEVEELSEKGIKVLDRRHLESYLLDDEIIKKWCATVGKAELENSALTIKQQAINASISRGNATDDIKSASNDIVTNIKKLLGLTACGNNVKFTEEQSSKNNFHGGCYSSWGKNGYYCFNGYPIIEIQWANWDKGLIAAVKGKVSRENPYCYAQKKHKPGVSLEDIGYLVNTSQYIKNSRLAMFRISKYSSVKGVSCLSGERVPVEDYHCHHIIPRCKGGTNDFQNLCVLSELEHRILHGSAPEQLYDLYPRRKKQIKALIEAL